MEGKESILRIATTNRHIEMMMNGVVDGYFLETLNKGDEPIVSGYQVVKSWHESGLFAGYDVIEIYVTSKPTINIGIYQALKEFNIKFRVMEHQKNGLYREVKTI